MNPPLFLWVPELYSTWKCCVLWQEFLSESDFLELIWVEGLMVLFLQLMGAPHVHMQI